MQHLAAGIAGSSSASSVFTEARAIGGLAQELAKSGVDRVSTNILNMIPDFVGTERMLQYCCSNKLPLRVEVEAYGLDDLRHECIFADVQQQLGDGSTAVTYNMRLLDPSTLDGATMQHIDEVQGKLPTVPHLSVSLPPGTELVIKVAKLPDNRHSADTKHVMFASEHNVMAEAV